MASSVTLFVWAYVCVCVTQLSRQTAMLLRFFMWHKMCDRCKSCASAVAVADIGSGSSSSRGSGRGTAIDVSQCLLIFLFYFYTNHVVQPTKNTYSHTHIHEQKQGGLARSHFKLICGNNCKSVFRIRRVASPCTAVAYAANVCYCRWLINVVVIVILIIVVVGVVRACLNIHLRNLHDLSIGRQHRRWKG